MPFSDKEVEMMRSIFARLEPGKVESIQLHYPEALLRSGYTFGVCNWKKEYTLLYQNFNGLSAYRMKLLLKLSQKVPYKLQITHPREDLICIGWKFE